MKKILTSILALSPLAALAGSAAPAALTDVFLMSNGVAMVVTPGARTGAPACAIVYNRFAVDATTAAGKAQLAGLLTAHASGKAVEIIGTGVCSAWSDTESINYVHVLQ